MNDFEKMTSKLTFKEMIEIIKNYDHLEKYGCVGDCLLRTKAEEYYKTNENNLSIILIMHNIVFKCYERLAKKYIKGFMS